MPETRRSALPQSRTLYVGWEVHQASRAVASLTHAYHAAGVSLGPRGPRQGDSDQLMRQLPAHTAPLGCGYAAGPWGSWLARALPAQGPRCGVGAPACLPHKAGDRGTTDRRDARHRARRMRSGDRPPVSGPAVAEAASRAGRRAREETRRAVQAAQRRLHAFVLRPERRAPGRAHRRPAPLRGLRAVGWPPPAPQMVVQADVQTVTAQTERLGRLARARPAPGHPWRCAPGGEARPAWRGGPCTVAGTRGAARGARPRCAPPRPRLHARGLTPAAPARGARRQPGQLTPPGPPQARRALVAGAWAERDPVPGSRPRPRRRAQRPPALQARSGPAPGRRGTRERPRMAPGTTAPPVVGAMAREWRAWLGALATPMAGPPPASSRRRGCRQSPPRGPTSIGSGAAPVWGTPRQRYAAARDARPSPEAGTRRPPGRGEPTPGEPRAHPSGLPGAASCAREKATRRRQT